MLHKDLIIDISKQILFLTPVIKKNIWGGNRLKDDFNYEDASAECGECWGISANPNGDDRIKYGDLAGLTLSQVWKDYPEVFGNLDYDRFPLLVKIIDAKNDLSIQVHPDDEYANKYENGSLGKTECWYILDCPDDATLVIGHNAKSKDEVAKMIHEKRWNDFIREVPVKKGDFIQIDPGTVHAIKGGFLILETQQNSDVTYRVYDYDRVSDGKKRELHIEKSIDVIKAPAARVEDNILRAKEYEKNRLNKLYECDYYSVYKLDVFGNFAMEQEFPFLNVTVVSGSGSVGGNPVSKGDHFIIPNGYGKVNFKGQMEIIASTVLK